MKLNPGEWSRLEQDFTAWAEGEPALRAAIAVGSRMRTDPPADKRMSGLIAALGRE